MRLHSFVKYATANLALLSFAVARSNFSNPLVEKRRLPTGFEPPQVWVNTNLVRNINLDKGYPREAINVVIKNVNENAQQEYYIPFAADLIDRIGGLEVRDKKNAGRGNFKVEVAAPGGDGVVEYYVVQLPEALASKEELTLAITFTALEEIHPLPEVIEQMAQQTVVYRTSAYAFSSYFSENQKTKLKFPTTNIPDYTSMADKNEDNKEDPVKQGNSYTYGPYAKIVPQSISPISFRYDFTKPLMHATLLEKDVEVSHWGGNLATEERYWLGNRAATLKNHFSRVQWQMTQYSQPPTTAIKELRLPLQPGSLNPYFTDDIGNVSTSKFRSSKREALLELKPRYPVFGGWKYSFRVGWDGELSKFLRKASAGDGYVLKIPFLEGIKMSEGVEYEKVDLRVILPEGSTNVQYYTDVPIAKEEITLHRTFMDTLGRPTLKLTALNIVDEWRDHDLIVTYDYSWTAGYRKPLTMAAGLGSIFLAAWVIGNLDTRIGKRI